MAEYYRLNDIPANLMSVVGGKARGLSRMAVAGFEVPVAFVITDISKDDLFEGALDEYHALGCQTVSVRSSASIEDGDDYSAAGQFLTCLNVEGDEAFLAAVRKCYSSLDNYNARNYSQKFLGGEKGRMNIVVQKMIDPRCAGVIFTKAPMRSGFSLVEAVPGLGENLVSGKLSAQQYRVSGMNVEKMPDNPCLSKEEAIALAAEGKRIEKLFGTPMDLEWAIDNDGKVWWLQARPITASESVTANELDCPLNAEKFVFTTGNIGEMMPGAVTPLNISTNMYALDWGVRETYIRIGCTGKDVPPFSYIAPYYNHMFFNMTNMYAVCHSVFGSTKETLDISICGHELEGFPDSDMPDKPFLRRALNMVPFLKMVFNGDAAKKGIDTVVNGLHFDLDDDMAGTYRQIIEQFDALKYAQYYHYCASYYSGGQCSFLMNAIQKEFPDRNVIQALVAGCLTQIEEFESASILRSMISLASLMLEDEPRTKNYNVSQLREYMEHAPANVRENLDKFMARHGHRGIREPEIMSQPWRANSDSFYTSLSSVISSLGNKKQNEEKPWTDYAEEIVNRCGSSKKKRIMGMIERARKGVCYREYTKSRTIYVMDQFRKAYRHIASLMVAEGLLPEEDLIFFLTQEEVGRYIGGEKSLLKKAISRKRLFPMQQGLKFQYCCVGTPVPLPHVDESCNAVRLTGTPVSRGAVTGIAHIVRNEADAALLKPGEIMIVESTDIGWTPYYSIVSGMVTEIGSALSHGIVVAREYALPAVVNVDDAMHLIHDGDRIALDGNNGCVTILK